MCGCTRTSSAVKTTSKRTKVYCTQNSTIWTTHTVPHEQKIPRSRHYISTKTLTTRARTENISEIRTYDFCDSGSDTANEMWNHWINQKNPDGWRPGSATSVPDSARHPPVSDRLHWPRAWNWLKENWGTRRKTLNKKLNPIMMPFLGSEPGSLPPLRCSCSSKLISYKGRDQYGMMNLRC